MKNTAALLDTSFFIRLLNPEDKLHENARGYFRYFLEHDIICKISTIAIAEFCVKGKIEQLPLNNLQIVPFNIDHANIAGKFCQVALKTKQERGAKILHRAIVPNDTKMFAQADVEEDVVFFVTSDGEAEKTFNLISELNPRFKFIDIKIPYGSRFGELNFPEE